MIPAATRMRPRPVHCPAGRTAAVRKAAGRARRALTGGIAALLTAALGACASGAERPTLPGDAQNAAPASVAPAGVAEVRENLATMRAETRAAMDATLIQSRPLSQTSGGGFFGRMFGAVGRGISDVVSLRAFGL